MAHTDSDAELLNFGLWGLETVEYHQSSCRCIGLDKANPDLILILHCPTIMGRKEVNGRLLSSAGHRTNKANRPVPSKTGSSINNVYAAFSDSDRGANPDSDIAYGSARTMSHNGGPGNRPLYAFGIQSCGGIR